MKRFLFIIGSILLVAGTLARLFCVQNYYEAHEVPIYNIAGVLGFILLGGAVVCLFFAFKGAASRRRGGIILAVLVVLLAAGYAFVRYDSSQHDIRLLESSYEHERSLRTAADLVFESRYSEMHERKVENAAGWVSASRRQAVLEKIHIQRAKFEKEAHRLQQLNQW